MLVAQISDLHITRRQGPLSDIVDTDQTLGLIVDLLNSMRPRPEVVLLTGDLTDNGDRQEYERLAEILEPLEIRALLLAGNHDHTPTLLEVLGGSVPDGLPDTHFSYVVDDLPVRLVGLDTSVPGAEHGEFDDARSDWLDLNLRRAPRTPTLIFMHHPPFRTGIRWMDLTRLRGADRFEAVIAANPQVRLVVAGHLHRPVQTTIGSAMVSICPSTAFQIGLHLESSVAEVTDQPPSYQLHLWSGDRFVTHTAPVWDGRSADLSAYAATLQEQPDHSE